MTSSFVEGKYTSMSLPFANLTAAQLRQAANLREKIDALQKKLTALLGAAGPFGNPSAAQAGKTPAKRRFSVATRAKMRQRARERWAKAKASGKKTL